MNHTLVLNNFKTFNSQHIRLRDLTILAGNNSVGKSSAIQALLFLRYTLDRVIHHNDDSTAFEVPLNGPFFMELGTTVDVVRRGVVISEGGFQLKFLYDNGDPLIAATFSADISNNRSYSVIAHEILVAKGQLDSLGKTNLYYLAAERLGPRLKYEYETIGFRHVGYRGEHTLQILSEEGIALTNTLVFHPKNDSTLLFVQAREWLNEIIPGANFDRSALLGRSRTIEGTFGDSLPTNVGFGISFVLPIIVNGLIAEPNSLFIVENPEAHLHPRAQSQIGQFLAVVAASGIEVVIETHSEHVINGIRIATLNGSISNENVLINFVTRTASGAVEVKPIDITTTGQVQEYPMGFFDQEQIDFAKMVTLRRKKSENTHEDHSESPGSN